MNNLRTDREFGLKIAVDMTTTSNWNRSMRPVFFALAIVAAVGGAAAAAPSPSPVTLQASAAPGLRLTYARIASSADGQVLKLGVCRVGPGQPAAPVKLTIDVLDADDRPLAPSAVRNLGALGKRDRACNFYNVSLTGAASSASSIRVQAMRRM
jgi:hypothetical protein